MLKLTNSFYRCLEFTCAKVKKPYLRRFSHLNSKKKSCGTERVDLQPSAQFHSSLLLYQYNRGKKTLKIKIPALDSNVCKQHKPMSDPLQPTINHASFGGQFDVSTGSNDVFEEWRKQSGEAASSGEGRRSSLPIPTNFRVWETEGKAEDTRQGTSFKFKVLSYNVLAQYLLECHPYLYRDCSSLDLKWKVRAARLNAEINSLAPDIICFQEVQASHLQSFYSNFEQIGYCGIFKQKTGHRADGCAIYFKRSLFDLMDHINVEFFQPELPILNRDNIGIIVKLIPRGPACSPIVVATTHLLYNPKRTDVRLAQMQVFLAEIDRFAFYNNGRESGHLPIILTGDFNSTPDSAVIKLLDRGYVSAGALRDISDWKRIGVTDNCQHLSVYLDRQQGRITNFDNISINNSEYGADRADMRRQTARAALAEQFSHLFNSGDVGHSLKLASVYKTYKSDGQCEATSFQDYWVTVDYIYFSNCSSLRLLERLRLPTAAECALLGCLPNAVYGSDHLALAALFELKPCQSI